MNTSLMNCFWIGAAEAGDLRYGQFIPLNVHKNLVLWLLNVYKSVVLFCMLLAFMKLQITMILPNFPVLYFVV